jgi:hypothetical protein
LLLGYAFTKNTKKFNEVFIILSSSAKNNIKLNEWLEYIKDNIDESMGKVSVINEYNKLFSINNEPNNPMYHPVKYQDLYAKMRMAKPKFNKRYLPLIDCALEHREIMYTRYYEKEIIGILNECMSGAKEPLETVDYGVMAYSAALEYIYCKEYSIEMDKDELIKKYNLSSIAFNRALKKLIIVRK